MAKVFGPIKMDPNTKGISRMENSMALVFGLIEMELDTKVN